VPNGEQLVEVVRAMRAGDQALREARRVSPLGPRDGLTDAITEIPGLTTAATLGLLRQAARDGRRVWLGYVNAQGAASQRIVEPTAISGGFLHGYDHRRDEMRTFALHRVTGVVLVDDADVEAFEQSESR
jgi:predicted DNA-binding transcriptional regulator YafY